MGRRRIRLTCLKEPRRRRRPLANLTDPGEADVRDSKVGMASRERHGVAMRRRGFWMSVGAVVVLLGCMEGTAMAKKVLWSAMNGRVLMNGQPAAGAVLARSWHWHWKNEKASDQAVANAAGQFSF